MSAKGSRTTVGSVTLGVFLACALSLACGSALGFVRLPDGRAWEMVSPLNKNGGDAYGIGGNGGGGVVQASAEGDAITYLTQASFGEPKPVGASANQYLAQRVPEGWSTQSITTPTIAGAYGAAGTGTPYKAFSTDLSLGLLLNGEGTGEAVIENPPLQSEPKAPFGYQNFYLRASVDGSLTALLTVAPTKPANEFYMYLQGVSRDLQHVVVSSDAALTPGATVEGHGRNLYEWSGGAWQAVNVLPTASGGETALGAQLGSGLGESNMISDNGSRVFWSNGDNAAAALYVRKSGTETVQIDALQGGPGISASENPFPEFQTASADGSKALFTSHSPLTANANTGPSCGLFCKRAGNDLYKFDVQSGELSDLSIDHTDENGAEVQGVLGASEDGSYIYFVATGILSTGANTEGRSPIMGGDNLYVWNENSAIHEPITFVGTLSGHDHSDWSPEILKRTARVAPGGQAVFMSNMSLTGYDNVDANSASRDDEVYLYDPGSVGLNCASCNPSGQRPIGSSSIPGGTPFEHLENGGALYQSRVLSEDGSRVFFDSNDALVQQDTNGQIDVYEYEAGHMSLISSGTSSSGSEFVDAGASGNDVFFLTRQQLVRSDIDQLVDLYDARVGGGLAEPVPSSPCEDESCRPPNSSASDTQELGSATFTGAGNLPMAISKPGGKPKLRQKLKKKHRTKGKRATGRKAGRPHGAARAVSRGSR